MHLYAVWMINRAVIWFVIVILVLGSDLTSWFWSSVVVARVLWVSCVSLSVLLSVSSYRSHLYCGVMRESWCVSRGGVLMCVRGGGECWCSLCGRRCLISRSRARLVKLWRCYVITGHGHVLRWIVMGFSNISSDIKMIFITKYIKVKAVNLWNKYGMKRN